jgi:hypothetical protein
MDEPLLTSSELTERPVSSITLPGAGPEADTAAGKTDATIDSWGATRDRDAKKARKMWWLVAAVPFVAIALYVALGQRAETTLPVPEADARPESEPQAAALAIEPPAVAADPSATTVPEAPSAAASEGPETTDPPPEVQVRPALARKPAPVPRPKRAVSRPSKPRPAITASEETAKPAARAAATGKSPISDFGGRR